MRWTHTFVDRPIFATVISLLLTIIGAVAYFALPVEQYPTIAPPTIQVTRELSRRLGRGRGRHRRHAARAADQRRRGHALPAVGIDRRRPVDTVDHLRARHRSRPRPGAGPEPRRHRRAAAAGDRAPARRRRAQVGARPDDGGPHRLAGRQPRSALHLQLRQNAGGRPARPDRRRRQRHARRRARLLDARLDRSRPGPGAGADRPARSWTRSGSTTSRWRPARSASRRCRTRAPSRSLSRPRAGWSIRTTSRTSSSSAAPTAGSPGSATSPGSSWVRESQDTIGYLDQDPALPILISQRPGSNALDTAAEVIRVMDELATAFPPGVAYEIVYNPTGLHPGIRSTPSTARSPKRWCWSPSSSSSSCRAGGPPSCRWSPSRSR